MIRHLAFLGFAILAGCGSGTTPTPVVLQVEEACMLKTDEKGALTCEGSPDGCICGTDDGCGRPTGSCLDGACCTGCVTEDKKGQSVCVPGHGEDGLFGSHGGHCTTSP